MLSIDEVKEQIQNSQRQRLTVDAFMLEGATFDVDRIIFPISDQLNCTDFERLVEVGKLSKPTHLGNSQPLPIIPLQTLWSMNPIHPGLSTTLKENMSLQTKNRMLRERHASGQSLSIVCPGEELLINVKLQEGTLFQSDAWLLNEQSKSRIPVCCLGKLEFRFGGQLISTSKPFWNVTRPTFYEDSSVTVFYGGFFATYKLDDGLDSVQDIASLQRYILGQIEGNFCAAPKPEYEVLTVRLELIGFHLRIIQRRLKYFGLLAEQGH